MQRNFLINATTLSLTASGTTIGSGNTISATFEVARTLVRTGLGAGELDSGSHSWFIHYVVSAMTTPYEMRLKLQRRDSGGVMQSESNYGATRSATGTFDDDITWDSGTWNAGDQLALVWEHRRPSGTGSKNGTVDANGASWIDASTGPSPSLSPSASVSPSASDSPSVSPSASQSPSSSESPSVSPSASQSPSSSESPSVSPSASISPSSSESPSVSPSASISPSSSESPSVSPSSSLSPSASESPSVSPSVSPSISPSASLSPSSSPSPSEPPPPELIFADPGGDAVQADGYLGVAQGSGTVSFDTTQKRNGVGSWKCDSGVGNGNPYRKVAGVLGPAGRINCYFRYDGVPATTTNVNGLAQSQAAYSGGGFTSPELLQLDDGVDATATPAKNSAQGSILSNFLPVELTEDWIIDSIKIIYERYYSTASSIGISRVRWLVGEEEGPNHDNVAMPTSATVVEVDITADRTWTASELNQMQVIAEAVRGDTDTPHTQLWDYVKLQVGFRFSTPILMGTTVGAGIVPLRLDVLPSGSGVVLRLIDQGGATLAAFDGITVIQPNEFHRIAVCFVEHGLHDLEIKIYLDAVEELWVVNRSTAFGNPWPELLYGWVSSPGANKSCWFDQIYLDSVDDLSDPGPILMTAKLPAAVNTDNFDTTGGTGAVNERPVSLTNYRQQAGSSQVLQNYTLQTASVGDVDISDETYIGYMGWAIAKKGAGTGSGAGLTVNGVTTDITLPTSAGLLKAGVFDVNYPSNAAGIGLRSIDGDADTFLYECGTIVVYHGPPEDILFARYLLLAEQSAEVIDDLRASPPSSYMLRYWIWEGGGSVTITAYSITAEGESPRRWPVTSNAAGGSGQSRIGVPGIEVRIVIEVSGADTYVMMQGYPNL